PANRRLVKHRAALGSSLRYFRWHAPDKLRRSVEELLGWYGEGKLRPCITHRVPLERSVEAIRLLTDRKAHGKVVVVPDGRQRWRSASPSTVRTSSSSRSTTSPG